MHYFRKAIFKVVILFLIASPIVFSGCLRKDTNVPYNMTLEVWGVFDDSDAFSEINNLYKEINPQIKEVRYRKISSNEDEYEKELIDAIASGRGPDVIFFKNSWLPEHYEKIIPLPDSENNLVNFRDTFIDASYQDFVWNNNIFAMPLYSDTLALYYNKDLLSQAGIVDAPRTWEELENQVKILTKIDEYGNITQSGIALGRSKSPGEINRSPDILALLMMQYGAKMNADKGRTAAFNDPISKKRNPGLSALEYYVRFSQGADPLYTWNTKMDYSIDSFRYGETAMMINYAYWRDRLKRLDPKLNFEIAPVPQIDLNNKVNFGNYWGLAVTKNRTSEINEQTGRAMYTNDERIMEAWKYIIFVTAKPGIGATMDPNATYLARTNKVAARKDLIEVQKTDLFKGVFADQALTIKTWFRPEDTAVEQIFIDMIDDAATGQATYQDAIDSAASRFDALVKRY